MPTKYRVPPARRPNPITDDHSQPIAPPPRPPRGGGDGWLLALVIVLCVVLPLGFCWRGWTWEPHHLDLTLEVSLCSISFLSF